jgi:hypothetical protein
MRQYKHELFPFYFLPVLNTYEEADLIGKKWLFCLVGYYIFVQWTVFFQEI